ncbi:MAG: DUF1837 domain-containing protein [Gammaproteobacteria bacterium]
MIDIDALLAKTESLLSTMYVVQDGYGLGPPGKTHVGTCINFLDLLEMRKQFVEELVNTATAFVYSKAKQTALLNALAEEGRDPSAAWSQLIRRARKKFRPFSVQGQFSELLLCNLLQHYFHAAPLVRKMSITTNPNVERNGADAIHIARDGLDYRLYLGEAKTYDRKNGGLTTALSNAINDILEKYEKHTDELSLYTYEDFVPTELEEVARAYCNGTLETVEVHLVCIVTFHEKEAITGHSRQEKLDFIIGALKKATEKASKATAFADVPLELRPRLNFILFPVREMEDLIGSFSKALV